MLERRTRRKRALGILVALAALALADGPALAELIYGGEGNRLRRYDVGSIDAPPLLQDVLIERASAAEEGGDFPPDRFRDINGMVCPFPDESGRFIAGEDTGQPSPPAGWGAFAPNGRQIGKLTATYNVAGAEPFGCAFDPSGRLFTTEVGNQNPFAPPVGQLIMWFPPFDSFPGPPGAYPETDEPSGNFCKLATDLGTATGVGVDSQGRVYVAASSSRAVFRFSPPFPTGPDAAGGCGSTDAQGSPLADSVTRETLFDFADVEGMGFFAGVAFSERDTLYVSDVLAGRIAEFDRETGDLIRFIVDHQQVGLPAPFGSPNGLAVGGDGTLYYADLDLAGDFPDVGPGPDGKVRRVRFDAKGDPLPPEIVRSAWPFRTDSGSSRARSARSSGRASPEDPAASSSTPTRRS